MKKINLPLMGVIIFLAGSMMTACTSAASSTTAPTPVAEIDASADWYSEKLGLQDCKAA